MLDTLQALGKAPIVEESYRGPVLFAPDAADDIMAGLIGDERVGKKAATGKAEPDDGGICDELQNARAAEVRDGRGRSDDEGVRLGRQLVGSYEVDSEGVKAQAVTVVDKGMLDELSDQPAAVAGFPGFEWTRAGDAREVGPQPSLGVLLFKSSEPESAKALNEKLRQMASEEGKAVRLPRGYVGAGEFAAAVVSRVCEGWPRGIGARGGVQRTGCARAAK